MKPFPSTFAHFMDLAFFGIQVVEALIAKREFAHARGYARDVRAYLDRAERAAVRGDLDRAARLARREARATLKPLRVRSTRGGAA